MSDNILIKSGNSVAEISPFGAELKSFKVDGKEYIWQGDKRFWAGSSPILFPICSGLKDDEYILDGKTYHLGKHGFARKKMFKVENVGCDNAAFSLASDEETLKVFPFDFKLTVIFRVSECKLDVTYEVENFSDEKMYFSIGAHEGYICKGGIEDYELVLPQKETLYASQLEGSVLGDRKELIINNSSTLALKYDYFRIDALIFKDMKSRSIILRKKGEESGVKVTFDGFDYFLVWTLKDAEYVCLEPWCGITDNINTDKNIKTKEGIQSVDKGEKFVKNHTVEIF